ARRARRTRRHRRTRNLLGLSALGAAVAVVVLAIGAGQPSSRLGSVSAGHAVRLPAIGPRPRRDRREPYATALAPARIHVKLKLGLASGLLFDVRTGRVLWRRDPGRPRPIASLTKMMTALVALQHSRPSARVLITRDAVRFSGSGVGLLPRGKQVRLETLLYGLLLPSGNDAAIALAEHVAGSQMRYIGLMNQRARAMGLTCTHFSTVSGIVDQGNYSCATDLAIIAHAVLEEPLLRRVVGSRDAVLPLPIKGGKVFLYNNNPLLRNRYPGVDGVKTGFTTLAGPCLVASARRRHRWLGVVLLDSRDPPDQAMQLLNAGFAARDA
ncbi:MAG: serine hydrolase, partial [Actinomycetota bacterium]|nr:serine hydrolase [Actinomycetota bacterium]